VNKKLLRLSIIFFFVIAIIGTVSAWPGYLTEWEETDHGSCHAGTYTEASGTLSTTFNPLNATTAVLDPGTQFNITVNISGFTAAANMFVYVGISARIGDNHDFFFGVHNESGTLEATAFEVGLDSSGNSNHSVTLVVYAPVSGGSHTLVIVAVEGGESFGTVHPFNYLKTEVIITVKSTSSGGGIPGYGLFLIFTSGLVAMIPIILVVLHKRRKIRRGESI
jgi:hypothetical protein